MALKGEIVSKEVVGKMLNSRMKALRSKYDWNLIEPYLDVDLNIGSRNRSKEFISFGQFKGFIEEGKTIKELNKITSKHLIQFYSNFAQGKINISKEKFVEEYEKGLSLDEISEKYKITREDMTYLRQLYGQKNKGATYINRKKTEVLLTQRQKEILYGSMMGDAKRNNSKWNSIVAFNHGENQKEYLLWKYNEFKNLVSEHSLQGKEYIDKRSEYGSMRWSFYTYANTDIEVCLSEFYKSGKKEVSEKVLEHLTPLSIAVWYMDDGMTDWGHRSKFNNKPIFKFCTESFSRKSCENIKEWFFQKYEINVRLKEKILSDRIGYKIIIENDSIDKFVDLIKPYILPMFYYKIEYKEYISKREEKEERIISGECLRCPLGSDFSKLSILEQEECIDNIVSFYQSRGIEFLVEKESKWENHMLSVFNSDPENLIKEDYISFSNIGNRFLMSHFPNFWRGRTKGGKSPKEIFEDKGYLSDIIRKTIIQGYFPSKEKVLKGLRRYRGNKIVSGFMPCMAKAIYHKYCNEGSRVFDFCAGYGGRLFGAVSCKKVKSYSCSEIDFETYSNLHDLYRTLRIYGEVDKEVTIFNQDSILAMKQFSDKQFDFCFTSPPYFDAEIYSEDEFQSSNKYPNYADWFNLFLIEAIKEARRISKRVAINIANTGGYMIADDLERYLKKNDIEYIVDHLKIPQYGGQYRMEPLFTID